MDHRCAIPGCVDPSDPVGRAGLPPHPEALLCQRHFGRLARLLAEMPAVAQWLHTSVATSRGHRNEDRISGSRAAPVLVCTGCHEAIPEDRYGLWARYLAWVAAEQTPSAHSA